MRKRIVLFCLYATAASVMVLSMFVIDASVQAQQDPLSDLPVVATPAPTPPHGDIPLGQQTCDQLEATFDYTVAMRQTVEGAYRNLDCDTVLGDPNATASDKAICENMGNRWTYWNNFGAAVRSVAMLRQCPWAKR